MTDNQSDNEKVPFKEKPKLKHADKINMDEFNKGLSPQQIPLSMFRASYKGPIPPAAELAKYKEVSPDIPDRIVKMAENQAKARNGNERIQVKSESRNELLGILSAFSIIVMFFVLALVCVFKGYPFAAIGSTFIGSASLVGAFIYGTNARNHNHNKDKEDK